MLPASCLLLAIAIVGAIDVIGIHHLRARVPSRSASRAEALTHVAKGLVYIALFVVVPNVELSGAWAIGLLALVVADAACGAWDLIEETRGARVIAPDEMALHVVLSILAGATIWELGGEALAALSRPTSVALSAAVPLPLRVALACAALGTASIVALEIACLRGSTRADLGRLLDAVARRRPIHIAIELPVSAERLWSVLVDHEGQPEWDGRFSRITMAGRELTYETTFGPVTFVGSGRVLLERPGRQSSFGFDSTDVKNPILDGRGVWLVERRAGGVVFRTSYDYRVRWGRLGALLDRALIRPWFTYQTARSFERLAHQLGHPANAETGERARSLARRLAADGTRPPLPSASVQPA